MSLYFKYSQSFKAYAQIDARALVYAYWCKSTKMLFCKNELANVYLPFQPIGITLVFCFKTVRNFEFPVSFSGEGALYIFEDAFRLDRIMSHKFDTSSLRHCSFIG